LKGEDKVFLIKKLDPHFFELQETRVKIKQIENKLDFLKNLREAIINNELQNKKNKNR